MPYWAACRLEPNRERLALHCLGLAGFEVYFPRLRELRVRYGRKVELQPALFPGYCFVLIRLQWHAARWAPGILGFIMGGDAPAPVADGIIAEIRARERGGLVELPQPRGLRAGDHVRVLHGPFAGHLALYAGMKPRERVEILLQLLGSAQRVTLARTDVEVVSFD